MRKKTKFKYSGDVSSRLQQLRASLGYNQEEMAGRIGVSLGGYKKYEAGVRLPSLPTQERMNREFALSLNWLFLGKGPMTIKEGHPTAQMEQEIQRLKEQLQQAEINLQEREEAHRNELEEKAASFQLPPEIQELLEAMNKDDVLYYEILAQFKRYLRNEEDRREDG